MPFVNIQTYAMGKSRLFLNNQIRFNHAHLMLLIDKSKMKSQRPIATEPIDKTSELCTRVGQKSSSSTFRNQGPSNLAFDFPKAYKLELDLPEK